MTRVTTEALKVLDQDPARTAVLTDFDGTLSEIVDHPDDAIPAPGVVDLLARMVRRFGRVGVVSGRPVAFLHDRLPVPGLTLVGQYGLERWVDGAVAVDAAARPYAAAVAAVARDAEDALPSVYVERKGEIAVTLHWRTRSDLGGAAERWARARAAELGLVTYPTKMAIELRPPVDVDKGRAVEGLADGMAVACFAGDDHGDLSAFAALDRLVDRGLLTAAVKIAVASAEAPAELLARADLVVDGPAAMVQAFGELTGPD